MHTPELTGASGTGASATGDPIAHADRSLVSEGRRPVVLVVDDAVEMRELLRDVLEGHGWDVRTAASGGRALGMLLEDAPDLVILDLFMPGMTGFELRGQMLDRAELAAIPVIVLSAYWHRPSETLDAVAVVPKPINFDRLLEVLDGVRTRLEHAAP